MNAHITPSDTVSFLRNFFPALYHKQVFLVGGSVRDFLLGRAGKDIDLAVALDRKELVNLGFTLVETVSAAPIWFLWHHQFGTIEVTPLSDISILEEDLKRRDFTVNAMAMNLSGVLTDPLGGEKDLTGKELRPCSAHTFSNDRLRLFRAFRFAADGWHLSGDAERLIREQEWETALAGIPVERFSGEMLKACASPYPEHFFELMVKFAVGRTILPELFRMAEIPAGPLAYHPEGDLLTHSVQVLQRVAEQSNDPLARFCAFFHDIGKLATNPAFYPKHHGHDTAGFSRAIEFCDRLRLPVTYRTALAWISRLHGTANKWDELRYSTRINMALQAGKAGITRILPLVTAADKPGSAPISGWSHALSVASMNCSDLGVDPGKLEAVPHNKRAVYIMQKRVELLRGVTH
ncbi:MAG: HD domain-containing protein [Desulfuromonadaceae bacterium]|nr:HD domain-containing protein [Desulfuromonadaceae bacterium]MDD5104681.1 HD domain-containing protein [Desulfuromonadaceae bacterium]